MVDAQSCHSDESTMQIIGVLNVCAWCCLTLNATRERVDITVIRRHSRCWECQSLMQVIMVETQTSREIVLIGEVCLKHK